MTIALGCTLGQAATAALVVFVAGVALGFGAFVAWAGSGKAAKPVRSLAVVVLLALTGTAHAAEKRSTAEALLPNVLRLVGRFSVAHACPVGPREAFTNAHVVDVRPFDQEVPAFPYAWSDAAGRSGYVVPLRLERARDLATVQPLKPEEVFPFYFAVAPEPPRVGDRVWLLNYDWSNAKDAFADERVEARVTRIVANHIAMSKDGKPGSSGSCVLNERGEVVAINAFGFGTESHEAAGLAVGVWGKLREFPE